MRKTIAIGLLLFSTMCLAQDMERIDSLIKTDLKGNFDIIQEETSLLNESELLEIYDRHKKSAWLGALINYPLGGFGIGNFIQGDKRSGIITLTGYLGGIGIGILASAIDAKFGNNNSYESPYMLLGASISVGFHIYGFVRSLVYPSTYNNMLRSALQIGQTRLTIEPSLAITGEGIALVAKIRF